ncbi:cytochrome P450 [Saccharothrix syringae]|uniref:Cytochrome P450 n=1 Tax=Saccharothrix syringae TaxID=103733 RepID=A0A5Q0H3C1_SACSY|nr:cytochrome P450 [Saccharothrix syringae]QFZ20374.1 cytochrome P450 [Saccharothrix syringae]
MAMSQLADADRQLLLGGTLHGYRHHDVEDAARRAGGVHVATQPNGVVVHVLTVGLRQARDLLGDPRLSKDAAAIIATMGRHMIAAGHDPRDLSAIIGPSMINSDAPRHTRLRHPVAAAMTSKRLARLQPRITGMVHDLLDDLDPDRPVDLVGQFALPLPLAVMCDLLGVPEGEDRSALAGWSSAMMTEVPEVQKPASDAMVGYLTALIEEKRTSPDEALLSALVHGEVDGDRLTPEEVLTTAVLLVAAGHETTTAAIGNTAVGLLSTGTWSAVAQRPDTVPDAVQEGLRHDPPTRNIPHYLVTRDIELDGDTVPAGSIVMVNLGAANRDPDAFGADADRFDPFRRRGAGALTHATFGNGPHRCVGSRLATMEIEIALGEITRRWPRARLVDPVDDLARGAAVVINGFDRVDVLLEP